MFVPLSQIAKVNLGFKSLQNKFFYLNSATIDTYGVEDKYLTPILMLGDLDSKSYVQSVEPNTWLFNCKDTTADLRGTGARRYIESMADRSAVEKKQSGKSKTIREALEAQSGALWYAPKARPSYHNIWLRKAYNAVFSPFLFDETVLMDQRCNSVAPVGELDWKELAAVLTTSLFSYSVEINGAASMGAGALEASTKMLKTYPVLDPNQLASSSRKKLVKLAETVWAKEAPVDWSNGKSLPGKNLQALDEWILGESGGKVSIEQLYADMRDVCGSRVLVAKDKNKKAKKKKTDNIGSVAVSIAKSIIPRIQSRNFPEDFAADAQLDMSFNIDLRSLRHIKLSPLLDSYDIELRSNTDELVYEATLPGSVAEVIVRSLLWGRSVFSVSSNKQEMERAIVQFLTWAGEVEEDINKAIAESALGTGYEENLKREVYARLGIHPLAIANLLPVQVTLAATI